MELSSLSFRQFFSIWEISIFLNKYKKTQKVRIFLDHDLIHHVINYLQTKKKL